MSQFAIKTYNQIAVAGLSLFSPPHYQVGEAVEQPDAILLRSHNMHQETIARSVLAVARAGAGVNNVPVADLTARGIPVFNTPGANANAVKELVLASLFLASRPICQAWQQTQALMQTSEQLSQDVEKGKKQFVGHELKGRTLGVIGLGAIGVKVANAALHLGMKVIGYDPILTVAQAWQLDNQVQQAQTLDHLLSQSDFITLHIPLNDKTRGLLDAPRLAALKPNAVLLNFARGGIVESEAVLSALQQKQLGGYVTDFPEAQFADQPGVIALPHLGASTNESQENCAVMAVKAIKDYLEQGHIKNAVNFPEISMPLNGGYRLAIVNRNVPNMVGQITTALAEQSLNVIDLINKSKDQIAYTLIDVDKQLPDVLLQRLRAIEGVVSARAIFPLN